MDSFFADKQLRLLVDGLSGWSHPDGRRFVVGVDVGVFAVARNPAIVPDVLVSFDIELGVASDGQPLRSYFLWELGKPPDIVFELVSKADGGELTTKLRAYERLHVAYYIVFDPLATLSTKPLRVFAFERGALVEQDAPSLSAFGLALKTWDGEYECLRATYLRWCDLEGELLATGNERANDQQKRADDQQKRADDQQKRADDQQKRADDQQKRADDQQKRADALAAKLRAVGVDPDA